MADPLMPDEIVTFMVSRDWGSHHLHWHVVRIWDLLTDADRQWAESQGWSRYLVQEGEEGNGLQFLAMHRVMIRTLQQAFPQHGNLFAGWNQPPTDPADVNDPLPGGAATPFHPEMQRAIGRLHGELPSFDGEDGFGTYVETTLRPFPNDPRRRAAERSSGIHNYIHNRFADQNSSVNMGDPTVNILNQRFWRLHGWIDARWSAYRTASGRQDTDPRYVEALEEAEHHMALPAPGGALRAFAAAPWHDHGPSQPLKVPADVKARILRALYTCDIQ
jgi:hypothetical protein